MLKKISMIFVAGILAASCSAFPGITTGLGGNIENGYEMVTPSELQDILNSEEVTLINVHIPWEGNIPETDLEIPFDEIKEYTDVLPENKDEKIIIYCRSDSMGHEASQTLAEMGYTDVSNLEGGYVAWEADGYPFEEKP